MPKNPVKPSNPDKTIVDPDKTGPQDATLIESDETVVDISADQEKSEDSREAPSHPGKIGHFTILNTLGEGGMGAVYLAEQKNPVERRVALKLVHASLRSPEALARFNAERQAMARLSHPNIAALFEAGATDDGFPYFAMENVPGDTLVCHCDAKRLGIEKRLQLFSQVCAGVQHAHQKGIMHRDLKPSNLLVAQVEGEAIPKIIDFGIAKALDEPLTAAAELTGLRAIGTPDYMSPEALAGDPDLDTRSDVYSLGVVLYELLTGNKPNTPVSVGSSMRVNTGWVPAIRPGTRLAKLDQTELETIAKNRSLTVSELKSQLSGDLDWIVMKSIAEEPARRYASAADFTADIARHLSFEPVLARPPSSAYRIGRFVRRHRLSVAAGAMVVLALVLGIVGTTVGLLRAKQAEMDARLEAQRAEQVSGFMTGLFEVSDPGEARGNSITARELLDRAAQRIANDLSGQPLLQARLMQTMGDVYSKLGLYEVAETLDETALDIRTAELGEDDPEVADALQALGTHYRHQARYQEAADHHARALVIREQAYGRHHAKVAESLNSLAQDYWFLDKGSESENLYRRALSIREEILGPAHLDVAVSLHHLGWLLKQQQRYDEAIALLRRALDIRDASLGEDHFLVLQTIELMGDVYTETGAFSDAEPLYHEALRIGEKVLDKNHPDLAYTYRSIGVLYRFQQRNEEAVSMLQKAANHFAVNLGTDHYEVANTLNELGLAQAGLGRWSEAATTYRRQLQIYESTLTVNHELIGQALNNLGWVLSDGLQRYVEGEDILRRAVAIFKAGDPDGYWSALSRWSLANNLRDQGHYTQAEGYFERAYSILERTGGADRVVNPDLDQLVGDYAKSLREAGQEEQAVALEARLAAPDS